MAVADKHAAKTGCARKRCRECRRKERQCGRRAAYVGAKVTHGSKLGFLPAPLPQPTRRMLFLATRQYPTAYDALSGSKVIRGCSTKARCQQRWQWRVVDAPYGETEPTTASGIAALNLPAALRFKLDDGSIAPFLCALCVPAVTLHAAKPSLYPLRRRLQFLSYGVCISQQVKKHAF